MKSKRPLSLLKWLAPAAALFALACALLAPAEAGSRPRTPRAQETRGRGEEKVDNTPADSAVRGRVVYDETSRPVRRAHVILIADGGRRGEHGALTDARGEFRIANVRAGGYIVFVDMPGVLSPVGFISIDELRNAGGEMPDLGEGRKYFDRVEVDGKQDVTVTVHARRGGALSGRVSYADGDPAANVAISLMRRGADGGAQRYLVGGSVAALAGLRTDDRGAFRLTGLPPGEYLVGVSEAVSHGDGAGANLPGQDLAVFRGMFAQQLLTVYYPSATSLKEAGAVKVEPGEERADVDITIPERDLRNVGGVLRARRGGAPVANARITIRRRDDSHGPSAPPTAPYLESDAGANSTTTDEAGRWHFKEIPDGAYTLQIKPSSSEAEGEMSAMLSNSNVSTTEVETADENSNGHAYRPRRPRRSYAPVLVNLDVSGGDVSEFVVELAEGGRVSGTVTIEGGARPSYGRVSLVRVGEAGAPDDSDSSVGGGLDGGRFSVEGLSAGRFTFQAYVGGGDDEEFYLKSISWNGKDLMREPLELNEGAAVEGVRVVFARNPAKLDVSVRPSGGRRRSGVHIFVMPSDLSRWTLQTQPPFCRTGENGTCRVSAAPGEYVVVAIPSAAVKGTSYEAELRRRASTAPRVTLRGGETARAEVDAPDN